MSKTEKELELELEPEYGDIKYLGKGKFLLCEFSPIMAL
jgi:hypothetical protein